MRRKLFVLLALVLVLITLTACSGITDILGKKDNNSTPSVSGNKEKSNTDSDDDGKKVENSLDTPAEGKGVYTLTADGTYHRDVGDEDEEVPEGFIINYSFSLYACQVNSGTPLGAGEYEGVGNLSTTSDVGDSIAGLLGGMDLPMSIGFDMSSKALGRSISFSLREYDSPDISLWGDCAPIFDGGRQINLVASGEGFGTSQNLSDEGACPLPMTIEVYGKPEDAVRPAIITISLCEGETIIKYDGTLSFVPWSGSGNYTDSDEFIAKSKSILDE